MSFATSSLGASLCFLVCFTSNACLSPLQLPMEPKNLIETVPLDVWHEILKHLNGYDKCLNYLSRIIALPHESYDTIARELIIRKESAPLDEEIDYCINEYFNTTRYHLLKQAMRAAFRKIIQQVPDVQTMLAKVATITSVKETQFLISLTNYHIKLANYRVIQRVENNIIGFIAIIALSGLFWHECTKSLCYAISDFPFWCYVSVPFYTFMAIGGLAAYFKNSSVMENSIEDFINRKTGIDLLFALRNQLNERKQKLEVERRYNEIQDWMNGLLEESDDEFSSSMLAIDEARD